MAAYCTASPPGGPTRRPAPALQPSMTTHGCRAGPGRPGPADPGAAGPRPANLTAVTTELVLLSRVSYGGLEITGSRLQGLLALLAEDPHVGCSAARLAD